MLVARYEYDHDRWNFPTVFVLPVEVQLNYVRELLSTRAVNEIMLRLTNHQFADEYVLGLLTAFIVEQPQLEQLVVELDHSADTAMLAQWAPRYRAAGMLIALVNVDVRKPVATIEARLPYLDMLKIPCGSMRARFPNGVADETVREWGEAFAPYQLDFVIAEIENSVDAAFAKDVLNARYLQGYYFDRPELPRLA